MNPLFAVSLGLVAKLSAAVWLAFGGVLPAVITLVALAACALTITLAIIPKDFPPEQL